MTMIASLLEQPDAPPQVSAEPREGVVWLASYPKSGNTWFRIFMRNLLRSPEAPESLDGIGFSIASCRSIFDDLAGIDSSEMTHEEIDSLRPRVYEQIVAEAEVYPIFMKTHDAYTRLPNGEPMLSRSATAGAIYFIRNPLDVAVSLAHHSGHENFDRTVAEMGSRNKGHFCHKRDRLNNQLRQLMHGWSGHVESWLDAEAPVHIMRYEDMKENPLESFSAAVRFAGLSHSEEEIARALEKSRFERLQEIERESGFREKTPRCTAFFRKGETGAWREKLKPAQVEKILSDHGEIMRRFGYVTRDGDPLF